MEADFVEILSHVFGKKVPVRAIRPIGGGCIHHAYEIDTGENRFFLKFNNLGDEDMFRKEYLGLKILRKAGEIAIPEPLYAGSAGSVSFLLTEFIGSGTRSGEFWPDFGASVAKLHKNHLGRAYGFDHDNYIGRLEQKNKWEDNWIQFFTGMRLEVQLVLALENNLIDRSFARKFRKLYDLLPDFLPVEPPSLLHGDLWGGNFLTDATGKAVLIDPAVYFGNREIEIAFTGMFGGFDPIFYQVYNEVFPLQPGFEQRIDIYNLYPGLVHANLFGTSYLSGIESVLRKYL